MGLLHALEIATTGDACLLGCGEDYHSVNDDCVEYDIISNASIIDNITYYYLLLY